MEYSSAQSEGRAYPRVGGVLGGKLLITAALVLILGQVADSDDEVPAPEFDLLSQELLRISWEDEGGEYELETSFDLKLWGPLPNPPTLLSGRYELVVGTAPRREFFRLRATVPHLYVVNASDDFTSYANFQTASGNVAPTSRLQLGSQTMLFQPRTTAVTRSGRLLISRGNGGIVGWNNAATAEGTAPPDVTVDGAATGLDVPIAFAYDRDEDRLFVGNVNADRGILVFDDVSGFGFDGNIAPDRTFGPDDRVPFNAAPTTQVMTLDAFTLLPSNNPLNGSTLYAVDTSGGNANSSRILVFEDAGSANGMTNPNRTITGPWTKLRSIDIEDGRLYAVDDTNVVFLVDNIRNASGQVNPTQVTVEGSAVKLRSVVAFNRQLYFLDENNRSILAFQTILDGSDQSVAPDRAIKGSATRLRLPTNMAISPGAFVP